MTTQETPASQATRYARRSKNRFLVVEHCGSVSLECNLPTKATCTVRLRLANFVSNLLRKTTLKRSGRLACLPLLSCLSSGNGSVSLVSDKRSFEGQFLPLRVR